MGYTGIDTSSTMKFIPVPDHMINRNISGAVYGVWVRIGEDVRWILETSGNVIGFKVVTPGLGWG